MQHGQVFSLLLRFYPVVRIAKYEEVSKIFRTSATNHTAVVVKRSTCTKRPNCEFRDLLRLLLRLRVNVRRHRPKRLREQASLLYHDNAQSHTSVLTQQLLAKYKMTVIPHPPYSPHLAPCDFFLFPKMKLKLKGQRFGTTEEIQAESESA
jgi:hypothetical protein